MINRIENHHFRQFLHRFLLSFLSLMLLLLLLLWTISLYLISLYLISLSSTPHDYKYDMNKELASMIIIMIRNDRWMDGCMDRFIQYVDEYNLINIIMTRNYNDDMLYKSIRPSIHPSISQSYIHINTFDCYYSYHQMQW